MLIISWIKVKHFLQAIINSSARAGLKLCPRFLTKLISYPFSARESVLREGRLPKADEKMYSCVSLQEFTFGFYRDPPANLRDKLNLISSVKFSLLTLNFHNTLYFSHMEITWGHMCRQSHEASSMEFGFSSGCNDEFLEGFHHWKDAIRFTFCSFPHLPLYAKPWDPSRDKLSYLPSNLPVSEQRACFLAGA